MTDHSDLVMKILGIASGLFAGLLVLRPKSISDALVRSCVSILCGVFLGKEAWKYFDLDSQIAGIFIASFIGWPIASLIYDPSGLIELIKKIKK